MSINKSQITRDFWRNVIDNNTIDLNNQDARKAIVTEFLNNPENKKAGWKKGDRRFFRLSFDKVCKERGVSALQFGVKPEPKRIKTQAGKMNISVNTDEKKIHPLLKEENEKEEWESHESSRVIAHKIVIDSTEIWAKNYF